MGLVYALTMVVAFAVTAGIYKEERARDRMVDCVLSGLSVDECRETMRRIEE